MKRHTRIDGIHLEVERRRLGCLLLIASQPTQAISERVGNEKFHRYSIISSAMSSRRSVGCPCKNKALRTSYCLCSFSNAPGVAELIARSPTKHSRCCSKNLCDDLL